MMEIQSQLWEEPCFVEIVLNWKCIFSKLGWQSLLFFPETAFRYFCIEKVQKLLQRVQLSATFDGSYGSYGSYGDM